MVAVLLSEFIPRQLRAEEEAALAEAYKSPSINLPKGVVQYLMKLVGLSSADRHRNSARNVRTQQHIEMVIQNSDDAFVQNLVAAGYNPTDMRCLNGRSEDAAFTEFIDVVHRFLSQRDQLAADERTHGEPSSGAPAGEAAAVRPSSLASSMRALHSKVKQMMYADTEICARLDAGTSKIPALSTFATFMSPSHHRQSRI